MLHDVTDAAGGHGIAVARNESPSVRTELIFTPGSYRFVGVQEVLTRQLSGLRPGTVWAASSLAGTKIVNTAPVTPLGQSYAPQTCGFMPGLITVGSSGSPGSGTSSSETTGP